MPLDPNIALQVKPIQIESPVNALQGVMQLQGLQRQNALGAYQLQEAQANAAERNALRSYLQRPDVNLDTAEGQQGLYGVAPTQAAGILKGRLDLKKTQSEIGATDAKANKENTDASAKALESYRGMLSMVRTPQDFATWVDGMYSNPSTAKIAQQFGTPDEVKQRIPTDPVKFQDFLQANAMGMDKFIQNQTTVRGQDITRQNSLDTNATHIKTTAMANATSTANNRATIAKDLQIAGVGPGGGLDDNAERTAQAIANGQLPAPTGMALLNPKNQRILGRVMEINPQYDSTTVTAKKKAASDFTTGQLGNSMRSFAVAGQHLDQLGQLVDAMDNGNMQVVNKIANAYSQQTGSPAVTNFDAAKDVVSKEVVKAIVAGGGGVAEREELSKLMSNAKSPAQLKGVIAQYRTLMAAQHDALLQQRDAAGLPRSTLPSYTDANGSAAPAAPSGWKYVGTVK